MNNHNLIAGNDERCYKFTDEDREKARLTRIENAKNKKLQRDFLKNALKMEVTGIPKLQKLATSVGLKPNASLNEVLVVKLLINTMSKGTVSSLRDIQDILGEERNGNDNGGELILSAIKSALTNNNNDD